MKHKDFSPDEHSTSTRPPTATALAKQIATSESPSQKRIARRANSIYVDRGRPQGQDVQHWLEEARRQVASLVSSTKLIAERASSTTPELPEIPERFSAHSHWGINE